MDDLIEVQPRGVAPIKHELPAMPAPEALPPKIKTNFWIKHKWIIIFVVIVLTIIIIYVVYQMGAVKKVPPVNTGEIIHPMRKPITISREKLAELAKLKKPVETPNTPPPSSDDSRESTPVVEEKVNESASEPVNEPAGEPVNEPVNEPASEETREELVTVLPVDEVVVCDDVAADDADKIAEPEAIPEILTPGATRDEMQAEKSDKPARRGRKRM